MSNNSASTTIDVQPPVIWRTPGLRLVFAVDESAPVSLRSIRTATPSPGSADPNTSAAAERDQRLVELSATGHGRFPGSFRHVDTILGSQLRYLDHTEEQRADEFEFRIVQREPATGLRVTSVFLARGRVAAFQTWTEVAIDGPDPLTLDFASTLSTGAFLADTAGALDDFELLSAENDWVAESRWRRAPLRDRGLVYIDSEVHQQQPPRSRCLVSNRGSWSTGEALPTGVLVATNGRYALGWQLEHNGPWNYEIGETRFGAYLLLAGPTDQENQWSQVISDGRPFTSAVASVVIANGGADEAFAALTDQRRAIRRRREVDASLPIIFNDYMNTLMGDPTTAKLIPLIDAAAAVGAEYFCIDAGWYAEGHWWDSVGAWQPAESRFPGGGLAAVIDHIRSLGMVAGLWLEPEVIGIHSPLAATLPDDAFFSRNGIRVAEHGRHLLDLTSPAAVAHLNEVVDRLVDDYGAGFIKLDYNTMTGPGTDSDGRSPGQGLLDHNRAFLRWLDAVQARHPRLIIENCASGAMRMDYAMLSRLHLQSTSDQQDPVAYATIAAAAPASILPEQAGNWAYPASGMSPEVFTFALANAILGRMYLSGYLNRMSSWEIALVREAMAAQRSVLTDIERSHPFWPLGLPAWTDPWVTLGLDCRDETGSGPVYLAVWRRPGAAAAVELPLAGRAGSGAEVDCLFPADQQGWSWELDAAGTLHVTAAVPAPTARVLVITEVR